MATHVVSLANGYTPRRVREGLRRDLTNTRWTIVLQAGGARSSTSDDALATLYKTYSRALYAFLLRRGHAPNDAEDLIQAFWLFLLEKDRLRHASHERGRFRSFLFTSLNHFVINQHDREHAKKRGGGVPMLPLEVASAEGPFQIEPPNDDTPDKVFDRHWALTIIERAFARLREGMTPERARHFEVLKVHLAGDRTEGGYARTAASLGISEGAARTEVLRLKDRLGEFMRDEIAHTVSTPDEIEDEIRYLLAAVSR